MKTIAFWSLIFYMINFSCNNVEKSPIEGAWQLTSEYYKSGERTVAEFPVDITGGEIKIWSGINFIFVGRFKQDTVFTDSYGGGTFKLEGNLYEESVQYHSVPDYVGQKVKIFLEVKNDTIIQTYPVDDNGKVYTSEYYIEKWVRIK